jgi:hypothetical protein
MKIYLCSFAIAIALVGCSSKPSDTSSSTTTDTTPVAAADKKPSDPMIGTWTGEATKANPKFSDTEFAKIQSLVAESSLQLNDDHTFGLSFAGIVTNGTWKFGDSKLVLTPVNIDNVPIAKKKQLMLADPKTAKAGESVDSPRTFVLSKDGHHLAQPAVPSPVLVGFSK